MVRRKSYIYNNRKKTAFNLNSLGKEHKLLALISITLVLGVIFGSFLLNKLNIDHKNELVITLNSMLNIFKNSSPVKYEIFINSLIKYSIMVTILWIVPIFSESPIPALILIFIKGTSLGFTTSLFMDEYGVNGIFYVLCVYFPQNLIITFIYFLVSYYSLNIALYIKNKSIHDCLNMPLLFLALALCVLTAFIEAYITPNLINWFVI